MNHKVSSSMIILMILLVSLNFHISSCRKIINHSTKEERIRANFVSTFQRHFHTRPEFKNLENDEVYKESKRLVPGGPNPLHN
ncbi:hypothetical protein HanRHA438_Chr15g0731731 [Helianthus annuus]|nr:hypothetical protein HanRHA438_Chr15g0731731 [Helianthus annuus]